MTTSPHTKPPRSLKGQPFVRAGDSQWQDMGGGIKRKILVHDDAVMLVHVSFEAGAIGAEHHHPHLQSTLVESGTFDVTIGGETQRLGAGDTFFVATNVVHGVVAIEAGRLLDSFTPMRREFIDDD
jgi:quercetin dioxygenase-like cupin family protein